MQKYRILALIILAVLNSSAFAAMKTSTITFEGVPGNTVVDSNGMTWTIETNAASTYYDSSYGACFQSFQIINNKRTSYLKFISPHIKGKIHCVTVNASAQSSTQTLITILQANNTKRPTLTETPTDYQFNLYAEINGIFTAEISSESLAQQINIKSIVLVYDDEASLASETHYERVTNLSQLQDKDEIIITSKKNDIYRAMGGINNGYWRSVKNITWNVDGTINGDSEGYIFCPILLEKAGNYWHMRASEGYLYANYKSNASVKNRIESGSLLEAGDNAKAEFDFDNNNGTATLSFPLHTTDYKYLYLVDNKNYYTCFNSSSSLCIFRKIKQEAATIDVTFKKELGGWTSVYYQDKNLVVPEAFTAYAFTVTDGKGTTSTPYTTGDIIPKNTAVLLKLNDGYDEYDAGNKTVTVQTTDSEGKQPEDDMLLGSEEGGITSPPPSGNSEDYEFFLLTLNADSDPESIGFYRGAADGGPFTVGAHEAYLALPKSQSSQLTSIPLHVIPFLLGDANGDGQVSVSDVMIVVNYILGNNPKIIKLDRSDVNFDGKINVSDVMGIVHIILGSANQ